MGRFGQFLVQQGKLRPEQVKKAIDMQQNVGGRLGTNVLELGLLREEELLAALGQFRRSRTVSVHELRQIPRDVLKLVPPGIARRHVLVPVERKGNTLVVASNDPVDPLVEDELGYLTSCLVRTLIGLEVRLQEALGKYYRVPQTARLSGLARRLDGGGATHGPAVQEPAVHEPEPSAPSSLPSEVPDTPPGTTKTQPVQPPLRRSAPSPPKAVAPLPSEIQYIELDDDTKQRIYTEDPQSRTPAGRLDAAADELQTASIRDEIGDVLLKFCRPYLRRRLLLIQRKGSIVGWRGEGEGIELERVRAIAVPSEEPSVFFNLQQRTDFWLGPLAPLKAHGSLNDALGGPPAAACLVVPIMLRQRVVSFLYADNGKGGVSAAPLAEIKRLATKAGVAFEVCILKNKIRVL